MAEGRTRGTARVLCRYYLNGCCRDGSSCKFSHDRTSGVPDNVCRYYVQGCCSFNDRCRYDHVRPNSSAKSRNDAKNKSNKQGGPSRPASSPCIPFNTQNKISSASHNLGSRNCGNTSSAVRMTVLKKQNTSEDSGLGDEASHSSSPHTGPGSPDWVNAPEFIPRNNKSYADTVRPEEAIIENKEFPWEAICQFAHMDKCPNGESCSFIHFETCELCHKACLHPTDKEQRAAHLEECEKELVQEMEHSFAIQRSQGKSCGICMDVVIEKVPPVERRFGILEKCNHVFCLSCIRQWRKTKQFESRRISSSLDPFVIRACPECRVVSDFVTPSKYWVDTKEEKEKLITDYKKALSAKPCKYFKQGRGECPFGGACFYLHAFPDGTKAELPLPRPRRRQNQDGELQSVESIFLWDFFELRDDLLLHLELEDVFDDIFSDSDEDSDWSDIGEEYLVD